MDWKTLLTGFVGALGGTATALALVGVFGKTLLEHWFKKDFKRYEDKLDALSAQERTKFEHRFSESAIYIADIYARSMEIVRTFNIYVTLATMSESNQTLEVLANKQKFNVKLMGLIRELSKDAADRGIYLEEDMNEAVHSFIDYALQKSVLVDYSDEEVVLEIQDKLTRKLVSMNRIFQSYLGTVKK